MKDIYNFQLRHNQRVRAEKMIKILKECGYPVEVEYREQRGEIFLKIMFDPDQYKRDRKRGAGRKRVKVEGKYTYRDVLYMMNEKGVMKTAETLGISRSTLYRKVKVATYKTVDDLFV